MRHSNGLHRLSRDGYSFGGGSGFTGGSTSGSY